MIKLDWKILQQTSVSIFLKTKGVLCGTLCRLWVGYVFHFAEVEMIGLELVAKMLTIFSIHLTAFKR